MRVPGVCLDEIAIALGTKGGIIQTVFVEGSENVDVPVSVAHIQWQDMRDWKERKEQDPVEFHQWFEVQLSEIVRVIESDVNQRFAGEIETLKTKLKPILPWGRIGGLLKQRFFGRNWLVDEVKRWQMQDKESRVFFITGAPGIGKSAFSAWLAHHQKVDIIAAHFVEYDKPDHKDPERVILSLAFQIASRLPDYRKFLMGLPELDALSVKNAAELFSYLLTEPLKLCINGGRARSVVLIDALDEADTKNGNELARLLAREAKNLPDWISFVVTSRPESAILNTLSHLKPRELKADDEQNRNDLVEFLADWLKRRDQMDASKLIPKIIDASEGNFLYLRQFCEGVENKWYDLNDTSAYPKGLTGIYQDFFKRQFPDIAQYEKYQRPLLEIIASAHEPLPEDVGISILNIKKYDLHKVLTPLGSMFPIKDARIVPYHKSLVDWLVDWKRSGEYFIK
jgi:hypothetical protein